VKKILYVISNSRIGGAETLLARVVETIDRSKYEPSIIVTDAIGPLHERFRTAAAKYNYINSVPDKPGAIVSYANANADIVHIFNHLAMWKFASSIRVPVVTSLYMDLTNQRGFAEYWHPVAADALTRLAAVITDYQGNTEVLPGAFVIPHGVDTEAFKPLEKVPKSVIWVGRLAESKGVDRLIHIAAKIPKHHITVCTPDLDGRLVNALVNPPIPNVTVKAGLTDAELQAEYGKSQFFLSTSHSEALPLTLIEAMSCGCIPIVPRLGGFPSVIKDSRNGYLYAPGATAEWLAARINTAGYDCGLTARETAIKNHSLTGMVSKYQAVYDRVIKDSSNE